MAYRGIPTLLANKLTSVTKRLQESVRRTKEKGIKGMKWGQGVYKAIHGMPTIKETIWGQGAPIHGMPTIMGMIRGRRSHKTALANGWSPGRRSSSGNQMYTHKTVPGTLFVDHGTGEWIHSDYIFRPFLGKGLDSSDLMKHLQRKEMERIREELCLVVAARFSNNKNSRPSSSAPGWELLMEPGQSNRRVLIVAVDPMICDVLNQGLSQHRFTCRSCSNGKEALEVLAHESFDAIVSDLQVLGMSGLELLQEVRQKYPRSAFLMVTGENDVRVGIQAMKQGASDYVVKPFELDAVVASLGRALEMKRLELELEEYRLRLGEMVEQRTKQLQAAMKRTEQTCDDTLEALAAALDLRDNETAGHSRRVTRYCLEMAKAIGCSGEQLKHLKRGAYLHDMGKICIPDVILLKPGKLTAGGREVMETHARIGYEVVSRFPFLASAAEIVLTHHERYDGKGYPQGLAAEEIPLGARIVAVANTLDTMTSDQPYRHAVPIWAAREEITRESGRQFDPELVWIFLSIPEKVWKDIRLEVAVGRRRG